MTKILLIDHSGRGHAFADLFVRTNAEVTVYYAPGCAAITDDRVISVPRLTLADPAPMVEFALAEDVEFVLVANAAALADGFVDAFRAAGVPVIGPDAATARLESSKSFTKRLCEAHGIPVAPFAVFDDPDAAVAYIRDRGCAVVVKADGLCGGNGSFVCETVDEALDAVDRLMVQRVFDDAGARIVVEDRLYGRELLFFALVSGLDHVMLPMAVDYPHSDDGNRGVISGGMGSFSPHPDDAPPTRELFERQVLEPLQKAFLAEGLDMNGVIYVGCMLVDGELRLLEINVRMGEPEAEVILPRVDGDFVAVCRAILAGELATAGPLRVRDTFYCNVVATQGATRQYSGGKSKGWYRGWPYGRHGRNYAITGVDRVDTDSCRVFIGQAAVHPEKGLVTDGGRCLHVVGWGDTLEAAVAHAYAGISLIEFNGIRFRSDIGRILPWETPAVPGANIVKGDEK
jgi:phosphoribosylamine--glycine ligase